MLDDAHNPQQPRLEVQGHDTAEKMFLDAFNSERLHHAWLITGPRGIGKALLAHRMARFLLHHPPADAAAPPGLFGDVLENASLTSIETDPYSPENKLITAGSHGDLITIARRADEKTDKMKAEIVVEDVRKLHGLVSRTSSAGGWRVAVIDSADEMNRNAANALLKILEEPPKNTLIFLLAHAPGRLLPTITSRCRQLKLKPLTLEAVRAILGVHYPDMSPEEISGYAILSNGSPGYGLNLVENQGLDLYIQLLELLASMPALDVPLAHKVADGLAAKNAEPKFALFGELLTSFISRMIRVVADDADQQKGDNSPVLPVLTGELELMRQLGHRISLDQWVDLWEKISHKMGQINLDRKQVILNILTLLNQKLK